MSERQLTPEEQKAVNAVYSFAATRMRAGKSNYEVEKELVAQGVSQEIARTVVRQLSQARSEANSKAQRDAAFKNMAIGGIICVIGLVVSIGSYQAAANSPSGGSYVVAWGAVIFGGIQFLKGLSQMME